MKTEKTISNPQSEMPVATPTEAAATPGTAAITYSNNSNDPAIAGTADPDVILAFARASIKEYVKRYYYGEKVQAELRKHFRARFPRAPLQVMRQVIVAFINWLVDEPTRAAILAEAIYLRDTTAPKKRVARIEDPNLDR